MRSDLAIRLAACERSNRRLTRLVAAQAVGAGAILVALAVSCATPEQAGVEEPTPRPLRVSELEVVDPDGVVRVRIGGDLPDAIIDGKGVPRGEAAAGVLLYDATGQERGGYVTWAPSGNVGLTLDTRHGQVALLAADPEAGSTVSLRHELDGIEMRSDPDGSRITAVREGQVVFQEPAASLGSEACSAYREALSRMSVEGVREACRQRFTGEACAMCLG
jgi:hypothetical protein